MFKGWAAGSVHAVPVPGASVKGASPWFWHRIGSVLCTPVKQPIAPHSVQTMARVSTEYLIPDDEPLRAVQQVSARRALVMAVLFLGMVVGIILFNGGPAARQDVGVAASAMELPAARP